MIDRFSGDYYWLSNFFIESDGTCVEYEFQAAKTINQEDRDWVMGADSPSEAKKRGRSVLLRSDWEKVKVPVMKTLVERKFSDHPDLAQKLIQTGESELIEGNWWGDTFWGVYGGRGQNHLGRILMEIRSDLLTEISRSVRS